MGESPPPKKLTVPSNGCQVVCSKIFFCWRSELQIDHVEVLLVDNKHRKLFVVKQSKGCKFMSKCSIIRLAASPKPAGRAYVYRVAAVGPTSERDGRQGRKERGDREAGERNYLKSQGQ